MTVFNSSATWAATFRLRTMNAMRAEGYLHASQGGPAHVEENSVQHRHRYDLQTESTQPQQRQTSLRSFT